jgi:hypothetical protein
MSRLPGPSLLELTNPALLDWSHVTHVEGVRLQMLNPIRELQQSRLAPVKVDIQSEVEGQEFSDPDTPSAKTIDNSQYRRAAINLLGSSLLGRAR